MATRDELRTKYSTLPQNELDELARNTDTLTPEAQDALNDVLAERMTSPRLTDDSDVSADDFTPEQPKRSLSVIVIGLFLLLPPFFGWIGDPSQIDADIAVWLATVVPAVIGANVAANRAVDRGDQVTWSQAIKGAGVAVAAASILFGLTGFGGMSTPVLLGSGVVRAIGAALLVSGYRRITHRSLAVPMDR